jgi:hypothetical protein
VLVSLRTIEQSLPPEVPCNGLPEHVDRFGFGATGDVTQLTAPGYLAMPNGRFLDCPADQAMADLGAEELAQSSAVGSIAGWPDQ